MSNEAFGNLGTEMRAMKAGRANLVTEIRDNHSRVRGEADELRSVARQTLDQACKANKQSATQTRQMLARSAKDVKAAARQTLDQACKANKQSATQTRQMLARSTKDVKAAARQTLAEAASLTKAIRKDVAALKAEAGRIMAGASGFIVDAGKEGAKRKAQTRRVLKEALAESKGQTRHVLTEATAVMRGLSEASRKRSAEWREILRSLHGGAWRTSATVSAPASAGKAPAAKPARRKTTGAARRAK